MANDTATAEQSAETIEVTRELAEWTAAFANKDITTSARTWATHTLLDWAACTVAGAREPLSIILQEQYAEETGPCTVIATGLRGRAHDAAMINGAAGHALDYDDVNRSLHGHPSVPVAPVVLALAEQVGASGLDVMRAFIAGYEVEAAVGLMAGDEHYDTGFHSTATMGTFGAAAAGANLLGLDAEKTEHALGIAAAQAAGIKSMFGTMTKPFHAGKAAMNGLIAAQIAARGFTAGLGAIERPQGFMAVAAPSFRPAHFAAGGNARMEVEKNLFKYHAACYLTHSAIDSVNAIRAQHGIDLDDMRELKIFMAKSNRQVCDIPNPASGLEIKFSIRHLAVMALDGANTAALDMYSDENARDPKYAAAREKVTIVEQPLSRHAGAVSIETSDGRTLFAEMDVGEPSADVDGQWKKLLHKARTIMTASVGNDQSEEIIKEVSALADAPSVTSLMHALR